MRWNQAMVQPRHATTRVIAQVLGQGRSLSDALPEVLKDCAPGAEQALTQAMSYEVLRWLPRLRWLLARLLDKPLRTKDADVSAALLVALYELAFERVAQHATVNETVKLVRELGKPWAAGLSNAVLRRYVRERPTLDAEASADAEAHYAHPAWLIDALRSAWPQDWERTLSANNRQAPMTLRVNARRHSRDEYLRKLAASDLPAKPAPHTTHGLILERPVAVNLLPGFADGEVSVQDGAAQLAAQILDPRPGERILDACAAPGGKSAHLLERQPALAQLVALDIAAERLRRVEENLHRLHLSADLRQGDAAEPQQWWDGQPFDRVLMDVPCSATGVIRRHPDIKTLRRAQDIPALGRQQGNILNALWPLVKPGGMVLYVTCSILPDENEAQIKRFLARCPEAQLMELSGAWGRARDAGRQILPGDDDLDGFYYCLLQKT